MLYNPILDPHLCTWFERISMFVIVLNCITLGMYQPCNDEVCDTLRCQMLEYFDHFIFAFFLVEMIIKMMAMGVFGPETYLAEAWNRLDCFIVLAGTIEYAVDTENISLSAIRTIRVLRPLRAINRIPSMRILVMLLLDTLPMLGNVLLLCFFVFFIFGIIGVQLWSGVLRHRCFHELNKSINHPDDLPPYFKPKGKTEYICSPWNQSGIRKCENLPRYEHEGFYCNDTAKMDSNNTPTTNSCVNWNQYYTTCSPHALNPYLGSVSFDNIGLAWVAIFQVISLESWVNIMYYIQDAHSFWDWIYFVALIVIGSFFMINLCLVVIATQFSETKKRETERMNQERKRFQSCSTLASNSEPGGCYSELLKLIAQVYRRLKRKVIQAYSKTRGLQKINPEKSLSLRRKKFRKKGTTTTTTTTTTTSTTSHPTSKLQYNQLSQQQHQPQQHQIQASCNPHISFSNPSPAPVHHHQLQHLNPTPSPNPHHQPIVSPSPISINLNAPETSNTTTTTSSTNQTLPPSRACSTPQAPRASPEQSDIDSMSSPRRPNYLVLPSSNYSLHPSSDSLATSQFSTDPFSPGLYKSQQPSPNHLSASYGFCLSRASSINSGVSGQGRFLPSLPEVLAAQGAKHAALAASNLFLNLEDETNKTQSVADKGLFADNLLMDMVGDKNMSLSSAVQRDGDSSTGIHPSVSGGNVNNELDSSGNGRDKEMTGSDPNAPPPPPCAMAASSVVSIACGAGVTDLLDSDMETSKEESGGLTRSKILSTLQRHMKMFVESKFFQRSILSCILLNTLSMSVEYHKQPDWLTSILEYSNVVFCVLFGAEMTFKIMAYGVFGYISNGFNVFDGFIVILSIVEFAQGGASGLSVLRTFRLLRILKLVRFMPALRRQLVVMLRTMDNVATFFALLVLFMFIFSILGMNLFGGAFCEKEDGSPCTCNDRRNGSIVCICDRANFDSLVWSFVTVFQVLTQEDWNTVLYNGMSRTSHWASLYFIALMTFGNYVLFNLLVAILVEGFSTEDEEKKKEKMKDIDDIGDDEDDGEKEKQRIVDNNNVDDIQSTKSRLNSLDLDVKNNKEKEKKMLALPPTTVNSKYDSPPQGPAAGTTLTTSDGPLNPPIITHTAATPMATPQGSPNENAIKDTNHKLSVTMKKSALKSTLSVDSDKSVGVNMRAASPRPSPCAPRPNGRGGSFHHQRTASWRLRNRRGQCGGGGGDKTSLVVDSMSDSADDGDDEVFSSTHSQSPTYSAGTPRAPSVNTHGDCNGHPPLNNQRALSPQNSLKGRALTPRNSFKSIHSWSRNNSVGSGRSICNSFELSRQNSFTSHRTLNSLGSGNSKDEKSNKNFVDLPDVKIALDKDEGQEEDDEELDPDAIDEADWNCSWCPEPTGCFLTRHEHAFYLLSHENRIRKVCQHLISRTWFDNSVLLFIALNCITLAMERPDIPPLSNERRFLTYSNYVFSFVFALEMVIKLLAKGLIVGKHAYLKSGWNVMDGFLVMISLIDILISLSANSSPKIFGILRVFRLLRTLRPLRVISRAPGLKLVVQTLLSSLRPIGNIVLICCTFFIIFGILGVQLFKGTFYYCKGVNVSHIRNRTHCENDDMNNNWVNQKYNFDNLGMALMALFVLASKDGWVQIMYTGLDAVGIDEQPIENYNEWRLIYFISFLLLVAFFVLNMFVGVVVENFHKCRESQEIEERAKRAAKRQEKLDKKRKSEDHKSSSSSSSSLASSIEMREPPYWANYSHSRLLIHTVINSKYFDLAIAAVIGLNVITMAMEYYMMPEALQFALKIFNFFFTSVFILEAVMKIVALGMYRYIKDRWNQLDIMIVILSIVGIVLEEMRTNVIPINPTIIRVMRVLRIARVLKLLKMAKGIRALLDTVIQALPQVGNLGLLFFLLFFIFAALGVELFGRLECSVKRPCEGLGVHAHFRNFGMAFLTLFRVATGDNWNGIMKDTLREDCDRSDDCLANCCVSPFIAPVYFVVFVLMAQFVLVNVVVAVLMKHLEETYKYKELDDELDEELRNEMYALALAGKTEADDQDSKDSHRMIDEDALILNDALESMRKENEGKDSGNDGETGSGNRGSDVPSFSFNVRPPSEEQSRSDDTGQMSHMNAALTIEAMASSWSSMDSNRLAVTPSMTGSSPNSERSVRISSPPIRRAHSPYLLSLQGHHGAHRRPLVKQYSMDVGSDPQLNSSTPDVFEKLKEPPKPVVMSPKPNMSRSQPSLRLKDLKSGSIDGKPGSLDSKDVPVTVEDRLPARERIKHKLLRSRSSGAKYSRFRDKYKQSNLNKDVGQHGGSNTSLSKERIKKSNRTGSNDTASDIDESLWSDWGSEEAACDEEVKMITGGTEDEEDDIRPTLSPYVSLEERENPPATARGRCDSISSSSQSTTRADSTPRIRASHPKCKSPMPPPLTKSMSSRTPGIDNTSFEMGEDMHLLPCCKARDAVAVRRSNSFSPSTLSPKTFSPPAAAASPHSDWSLSPAQFVYREHTPVSPLALPPSPLALEDSAYKMRTPEGGHRDSISPVPSSKMLTVPSSHSMNPHMRSPSPTPPKQVHLVPPPIDCALNPRRQPIGSPTPLRRQQTLTRSSAIDHDPSVYQRRSIPHTLSVDSAFLAPPGIPQSYSLNDPFVELHGGCRASSPLPSPRNSQQTLPGMFTRSASPVSPSMSSQQLNPSPHPSSVAQAPPNTTTNPNQPKAQTPQQKQQQRRRALQQRSCSFQSPNSSLSPNSSDKSSVSLSVDMPSPPSSQPGIRTNPSASPSHHTPKETDNKNENKDKHEETSTHHNNSPVEQSKPHSKQSQNEDNA